jgi:hypothetical protein
MKVARKKGSRLGDQSKGRSRITNGRELLPGVDGRSLWARRFRDLLNLHLSDLGGFDEASEAEKSILRRAAALTVELELLESRFAAKETGADAEQLDLYSRMSNTLRRHLEALGLRRRPKDVTPSVEKFIATYGEEDNVDGC